MEGVGKITLTVVPDYPTPEQAAWQEEFLCWYDGWSREIAAAKKLEPEPSAALKALRAACAMSDDPPLSEEELKVRLRAMLPSLIRQPLAAMSDETGERDDVTVDESGCVVQGPVVVQVDQAVKERASYEAWRKKEEAKGKVR